MEIINIYRFYPGPRLFGDLSAFKSKYNTFRLGMKRNILFIWIHIRKGINYLSSSSSSILFTFYIICGRYIILSFCFPSPSVPFSLSSISSLCNHLSQYYSIWCSSLVLPSDGFGAPRCLLLIVSKFHTLFPTLSDVPSSFWLLKPSLYTFWY